jgi:peroxiredoxin
MRKHFGWTLALALMLALTAVAASAQQALTLEDNGDNTPGAKIGQTIADFTLTDVNGEKRSLNSLKGEHGTVLIFISTQCPVSNGYNDRMAKLAADFATLGVNVIGINSNAPESVEEIKKHAAEHRLAFTILKDKGNKIADLLGAQHTPEAYLLDPSNKLVYRGGIDNSRNGQSISGNYLRDAMEQVRLGKLVTRPRALAFGCSIKKVAE